MARTTTVKCSNAFLRGPQNDLSEELITLKLKSLFLPAIAYLSLTLAPLAGFADPGALTGDHTVPNIGTAKKLFKDYYQSGRYAEEIKRICKEAQGYIDESVAAYPKEKLAMVLDIDETSLSNAPHIMEYDFGYLPGEWSKWIASAKAPAIEGTLELYKYAREKGVSVFFITGRNEAEREATVKNLEEQGFQKFTALILKPVGSKVTSKEFKTYHRRQITESGYRIIVNVGDQASDLEGGYCESVYKLPNPMYFVP